MRVLAGLAALAIVLIGSATLRNPTIELAVHSIDNGADDVPPAFIHFDGDEWR
jgi:hypothetical protein